MSAPLARPRSIRVPDHLWEAARTKAESQDMTVTDVILGSLRLFTDLPAVRCDRCGIKGGGHLAGCPDRPAG